MGDAVDRFTEAAHRLGLDPDVVRFPKDTRTAEQAAEAIGCDVAQIVKSLVFSAAHGYVLVLTSGANRVDEAAAAALLDLDGLGRADADGVRAATGFAIGGIPPCGHPTPLPTAVDEDLLQHASVWAAAGAPDSVFAIAPDDLVRITQGIVGRVAVG